MKEEKFKFQVGDIVEGEVSKSILEVIKVNNVGDVILKVIKSNYKGHITGETFKNFFSNRSYTLITQNQVKEEITYDIW